MPVPLTFPGLLPFTSCALSDSLLLQHAHCSYFSSAFESHGAVVRSADNVDLVTIKYAGTAALGCKAPGTCRAGELQAPG